MASALVLAVTGALRAQTLDTSPKPMTRQRADLLLQPHRITGPVKSLIPGEHGGALDTLETGNPEVKIILYADNTWKYIKNADILAMERYFNEHWNDNPDAYSMEH